jgi:transposase
MNFTQNQKINQVSENTIVVGIDIASETHYARAFDWRGIELCNFTKFDNSAEGFLKFNEWLENLKKESKKDGILAGAEPTGHYWFSLASYLMEKQIKFVLVNPFHVKRSKELDDNHPSKTDIKDPKTIAKLVIEGRYSEPYIPEGVYADLRVATNNRFRITKEINSIKNHINRWFDIYFPEFKKVFSSFDSLSSMLVIQKAPLPKDLIKLGEDGINNLWREKKIRSVGRKRAKTLYEAAKMSIGCSKGLDLAKIEIEMLLEDYSNKKAQLESINTMIENLCLQIEGVEYLLEINGIGITTVAGFLSEVGDIRRFKSPKQVQKLAGLSIKESSSGKHKGQSSISKRGRKRLRALLFQVSMPLVSKNKEFKEIHNYYTTRPNGPLKKKQSLIAICCKLIRVFYAILSKCIKYDSDKLVSDIKRSTDSVAA